MLTRRICLIIFGWWSFPFFLWPRCLIQGWHCKVQYSSEVLGPKCMWKVHFKKRTKACNFSKYTKKNMCKKSSLVCTTVKRSSFAIQTHVAQDSTVNSECTVYSDTSDLTLSTLAPVWVSSILFSIHLLGCWQGDCVQQSRASLVGDHLLWWP